jgi:hypothetical protein
MAEAVEKVAGWVCIKKFEQTDSSMRKLAECPSSTIQPKEPFSK